MQLYLIRHAHALDGLDDQARPLSAKGRQQVKRLAKFLRASGACAPAEIWHSPLVRAAQTAELLARGLKREFPRREVAGLAPHDDPREIAARLARTKKSVALVGHEPHLSALASLLVVGEAKPPRFVLKKCAALALDPAGRRWRVRWQVSPELLT